MTLPEQVIIKKLEDMGIRPGSGNYKDYEIAKTLLKSLNLSSADYEKMIRKVADHLKCQL